MATVKKIGSSLELFISLEVAVSGFRSVVADLVHLGCIVKTTKYEKPW